MILNFGKQIFGLSFGLPYYSILVHIYASSSIYLGVLVCVQVLSVFENEKSLKLHFKSWFHNFFRGFNCLSVSGQTGVSYQFISIDTESIRLLVVSIPDDFL